MEKRLKRVPHKVKSKDKSNKAYMSIKEIAEYSGLSMYAVRKLVTAEKIPFLLAGNKILIERKGLMAYLEGKSKKHLPYL